MSKKRCDPEVLDHRQRSETGVSSGAPPALTPEINGSVASIKRTRRTAHITSAPDIAPPQLLCPTCDRSLVYRQTVIGGVQPIERWDYFACPTCGPFVYRDRTRTLRPST